MKKNALFSVIRTAVSVLLLLTFGTAVCACGGNTGGGQTTQSPVTVQPDTTSAETTAAGTAAAETTAAADDAAVPFGSYRVLFIGNSYTYYNDMPDTFKALADAAGYSVRLSSVTKGSYTLGQFSDAGDEYGKQVDALLKVTKFDYVIIQEQSVRPAAAPAMFYTGARALYEKIKSNGAQAVLYATWGSKAGHSSLTDNGWTTATMEYRLRAAYEAIGDELDIPVSQVGTAFLDVYTNHPEINLYNADLKHPSPAGSYLAACVHYATVFGRSPIGLKNTAGLSAGVLAILQQAAHDAVFAAPALPDEYKTSSVGVTVEAGGSYGIDVSKTVNLSAFPESGIISVVDGAGKDGKTFVGITGDNGKTCSAASGTSLSAAQLADLADIKYGVSLIGAVSMPSTVKTQATFTGLEALVNGHWGSSWMANWTFGAKKYDISGAETADGRYFGLITLNFGQVCRFDAIGFFSGSLQGFPQVAEVFVSNDGVTWTAVPSASYDACAMAAENKALVSAGASPGDPWQSNSSKVSVLFSMNGVSGKYIRYGVIIGKGDPGVLTGTSVQDINTRELVVYGTRTAGQ